jgi:hypothetical protein
MMMLMIMEKKKKYNKKCVYISILQRDLFLYNYNNSKDWKM